METIKIIDLLNKIANGEEVPEQILYEHIIYKLSDCFKNYYDEVNGEDLLSVVSGIDLKDEVEILDSSDEFEYIEELKLDTDELVNGKDIRPIDYLLEGKINDLIKNQKKIIERLNNLDNN